MDAVCGFAFNSIASKKYNYLVHNLAGLVHFYYYFQFPYFLGSIKILQKQDEQNIVVVTMNCR